MAESATVDQAVAARKGSDGGGSVAASCSPDSDSGFAIVDGDDFDGNCLAVPEVLERPRSESSPARVQSGGKLRSKAKAAINNLANGWLISIPSSMKTFSTGEPLWLLGLVYHAETPKKRRSFSIDYKPSKKWTRDHYAEFFSDFYSRIWITYRRKFPNIGDSPYISDTGWGCMIRTGQMILAQALLTHLLGRGWRHGNQDRDVELVERRIISYFGDRLCQECPFAIHKLLTLGHQIPGQWLGPAEISHLLRKALNDECHHIPELSGLRIYVAQDSTVYKGDLYDIMRDSPPSEGAVDGDVSEERGSEDKTVLVLVPVRLGKSRLNPIYGPCINALLALDCCVGVIGGCPRHSLYFIGCQGNDLIYLDPHFCQDVVDTSKDAFPTSTYHCQSPRKMPIKNMDPSCALGFVFTGREDVERWSSKILEYVTPPMLKTRYPIFEFSDKSFADMQSVSVGRERSRSMPTPGTERHGNSHGDAMETGAAHAHRQNGEMRMRPSSDGDLDDFVVLD